MKNRVWVEINLKTLRDNFVAVSKLVAPAKVICVLKANAYGLGVLEIAQTLKTAGAVAFAVAELREALALVKLGLPVQILGCVLPDEVSDVVRHGIIASVGSYEIAQQLSAESVKQNKVTTCCFALDTGMGRSGFLSFEALPQLLECTRLPNLDFVGIYSHFPVAYQNASEITLGQIEKLKMVLAQLEKHGVHLSQVHIANSDAINNFPQSYIAPFTHVRTGINLHGSFDSEGRRAMNLKSVLTLKTKLAAIRQLPAGYTIGYGCTYKLPVDKRVGTVSAGYADGLPLALSNRGYVLIRGVPCQILGRVSMDYITVDLDNVPDAQCGDDVICLGGEGIHAISVEDWANLKGTHPYEIICSFGSRVERIYTHTECKESNTLN